MEIYPKHMVSVDEAKALVASQVNLLNASKQPLATAAGLVLAEDVCAPCDIPAFPQSSMDGYAFRFADRDTTLTLIGEQPAGGSRPFHLQAGQAVRIFTGAAVPIGADTVLMQEKAIVEDGQLKVSDPSLSRGNNVRPQGSEVIAGAVALQRGDRLTPASIGFLAGIGISQVKAYPRPRVAILVTGDELQTPGMPLAYGQVYESNSLMLQGALRHWQIEKISIVQCPDDPQRLTDTLAEAIQSSDIILMIGGVSVGEHDYTTQAFSCCGVQMVFHKVRQKPGKPLLFGMHDRKPVFGLPGNPASVLTCFYEYVGIAIARMMQLPPILTTATALLEHAYRKPVGLTHFLKASCQGNQVRLLQGQESYRLQSFAHANALALLPAAATDFEPGCAIEVHFLPV